MKKEMAEYILELRDAASATHRAEDRPIYKSYLADAAVLLALIETDASPKIINDAIAAHARLWGHTWLQDSVYEKPSKAWMKIKRIKNG